MVQILLPYLAADRRQLVTAHTEYKQKQRLKVADLLADCLLNSVAYRLSVDGVQDVFFATTPVDAWAVGDMFLQLIDAPPEDLMREVLEVVKHKLESRGHVHLFDRYMHRWSKVGVGTETGRLLHQVSQ